jgi:demethylmenaquinone methyltransferase/2-methoxy-6-polyprenyl-1,4-benzoquinol methylase
MSQSNLSSNNQAPQADYIKKLFADISSTYDTANDAMTLGLARAWRKKLVEWSEVKKGDNVLDCATGTGDLALEFKKVVGPTGHVLGTDFCKEMLNYAPEKAKKLNLDVQFEIADATDLPYKENEFNCTSISYGIRNVSDLKKALNELARVTKPNGYVMILETGDNNFPILKYLMSAYFNYIVPFLGGFISKNKSAYQYLNKSSKQFPSKQNFTNLALSTDKFIKVEYKTLLFGASYLYKFKVK